MKIRRHYTEPHIPLTPNMRSLEEVESEYIKLADRVWNGDTLNNCEWIKSQVLEWVLNYEPLKNKENP